MNNPSPRKKRGQIHGSDKKAANQVSSVTPAWVHELEQWERAPYDGIKGLLPRRMPSSLEGEYYRARYNLFSAIGGDRAKYDAIRARFDELVQMKYPEIVLALAKDMRPHDSSLLVLVRFYKAVQLDEEPGLALLTDPGLAGLVTKGKRYGQVQSRKAKQPRGKIDGDNGTTINQLVGLLALENDGESAKDLWERFIGALDEKLLNPQRDARDLAITYDSKSKRKTITFGTFEKVVSQYRTGRKNLP